MNFKYFTNKGSKSSCIDTELSYLFADFDSTLQKNNISNNQIVKLTVFYNPQAFSNLLHDMEEAIMQKFKNVLPAISYIAQPPLPNSNILFETCYVCDDEVSVAYKKHKTIPYTLISKQDEKHLFISGIQSLNESLTIEEKSEYSFEKLQEILNIEGFCYQNIIRQWNYIEGILDSETENQHYQTFNDVRTRYYKNNGLLKNYPAATGIGIQEGGIIIDIYAIKKSANIELFDITNPLQTDAFNYSDDVLEGKPIGYQKTTPKFSRAKAILNSSFSHVLVSGTASIHGEETVGLNDIEKQTYYTIDNIKQLVNNKLIKTQSESDKNKFSLVRVYVKEEKYYNTVKNICEKQFLADNIIYVIADVCRDNLLVEIEGVVTFSTCR